MTDNEYRYQPLRDTDPPINADLCSCAVAMPRGRWRQCRNRPVTHWQFDAHGLWWCETHVQYGERKAGPVPFA